MTRRLRLVALVGAGAIGAGVWAMRSGAGSDAPAVRTAAVSQGDVRLTVRATGTLEAVTTVAVGTQVSGVVSWLGADFNSTVRKGQVIARLDPSLLQAQVEQAQANLARVDTDVRQREMTVTDREAKYARARQLSEKELLSASDLEEAKLAAAVARMDLESTRAQVVQARASLNQALVNLSHATITAPIDGIVIQRSIDVGQTVAASLSSPTLFLIVGDLAKMRVSAAVDESDVARIETGQRVDVTVDAYPGRRFAGTVAQVRLQPTVTSNVTTYTTIVDVSNERMELKPGMTASAEIEIDRRSSVRRIPNTALRFRPTAQIFAALNQPEPAARVAAQPTDTTDARVVRVSRRSPETGEGTAGQVWVHEHGTLRRVDVRVGLADGTFTELLEGELAPGAELVTGVQVAGTATPAAAPSSNIFGGSGRGRS
ncbi:MAG TPA: efflux RND transporter periplasmic adaptor subunit [Vicinamibacterales bacterium]|nr:efflux RND transporter periplasmic adaptor subunit [Vicinamibacterales bacterium]